MDVCISCAWERVDPSGQGRSGAYKQKICNWRRHVKFCYLWMSTRTGFRVHRPALLPNSECYLWSAHASTIVGGHRLLQRQMNGDLRGCLRARAPSKMAILMKLKPAKLPFGMVSLSPKTAHEAAYLVKMNLFWKTFGKTASFCVNRSKSRFVAPPLR